VVFSFEQDSLRDNIAVHSGGCILQWRYKHQTA